MSFRQARDLRPDNLEVDSNSDPRKGTCNPMRPSLRRSNHTSKTCLRAGSRTISTATSGGIYRGGDHIGIDTSPEARKGYDIAESTQTDQLVDAPGENHRIDGG